MNHAFFIPGSLTIRWWLFEEPFMTLRILGRKRFWSIEHLMRSISSFDVSLLLDWLKVVGNSLKRRWWYLDDFDANINDTFFVVVISETLKFQCSFSDDSLRTHWRNIDDTTKIWMQTIKIIEVYKFLTIRTLMFFAAWLIIRWWSYEEPLIRFADLDANLTDNIFMR